MKIIPVIQKESAGEHHLCSMARYSLEKWVIIEMKFFSTTWDHPYNIYNCCQ